MFTDFKICFMEEIEAAGLCTPKEVIADGEIHRFKSSPKAKNKNGYYALHDHGDFMAGIFGCWESGVQGKWNSGKVTGCELSDEQRTFHEAILKQFELEQIAQKAERKEYATELYSQADYPPPEHEYLQAKSLNVLGDIRYMANIRCADFFMDEAKNNMLQECLLIPVRNMTSEIQSLQAITPNGKKFFMKGGQLDGGCFVFEAETSTDDKELVSDTAEKPRLVLDERLYSKKMRDPLSSEKPNESEKPPIYVCEGYATGSTLHEVTGEMVFVAFNAGGLQKLVPELVEVYGDERLIIAADNDHLKAKEGKGNKGLDVAKSIAEKLQIPFTYPEFEDTDNGTDWNDYANRHGIKSTKVALADNQQQIEPEPSYGDFEEALQALIKDRDDELAFDAALCFIKDASTLQAGRMRNRLKEATGVNVTDINKAIAIKKQEEAAPDLTHGEIADDYIAKYSEPRPVCEYGCLWSYSENKGVWLDTQLSKLGVAIANEYKGEALCRRESDYKAIASHVYNTLEYKNFFENAPKGVHIPSGFVFVDGEQIKLDTPSAEHRARFRLDIEPDFSRQPERMLAVLSEAFKGHYPEEQIRQLRMMTGLALFGLQSKEQRAVLLYGAAGSGKSLYLKLIEALVPKEYRTSVSPLHMDSDYKNAALAGKLMNLVPEIDKDKPVPSAEFKAITGGDTMSAREPYGKVFTFTPEVGCWFNGNYYLTTKDHSEGFWRRWTIVHFANSKPEHERDPQLLQQIIESELPAFLAWAIGGVTDYLDNGLYLSTAHHKCIQEWKRDGNSVCSWLHDAEDSGIGERTKGRAAQPLKVTYAYTIYKEWCRHNNRKPFNKQVFKVHMANNGHHESLYNGYCCFTGLYDARPMPGSLSSFG